MFRRLLGLPPKLDSFKYKYAVSYRDSEEGEGDTFISSNEPVTKQEAEQDLIEQLNASGIYPNWLNVTKLTQIKP